MKCYNKILYVFFFLGVYTIAAQTSSDCVGAIPICNNTPVNGAINGFGVDDFNGNTTTGCIERNNNTGVIESNSAWYHFKTEASGELGFNIGFDTLEDWDFALYKTSDCSNLGDPIRCNFFDNAEEVSFAGVGEDPTGNTTNFQYEDWLQVAPGEDYYLLINNFSNNNAGFSIQFSGNIFLTNPNDALDCSIISNLLGAPKAACSSENIVLDATTAGASQYEWFLNNGNGFVILTGETNGSLNTNLYGSGIYRVRIDATIISDVQVVFSSPPLTYPLADDSYCVDLEGYDFFQNNNDALGLGASMQSPEDFIVNYYESMSDAINSINPLPRFYKKTVGAETFFATVASKQNPKCIDAPQEFEIIGIQKPVLNFNSEVYLCEGTTSVVIGETNPNINYSYEWETGELTPTILIDAAGEYILTATNKQGMYSCDISKKITVYISETPVIANVLFDEVHTNSEVIVETAIQGDYEYQLDNGSFQESNMFLNVLPGMHTVTVSDLNGCGDVTETIVVVGYLKFFTPNGDTVNDSWGVIGMLQLEAPIVSIYDSFGKLLKQLNKRSVLWDGTYNGLDMPSADYWFKLSYLDFNGQRKEAKYIKSHFSLKR